MKLIWPPLSLNLSERHLLSKAKSLAVPLALIAQYAYTTAQTDTMIDLYHLILLAILSLVNLLKYSRYEFNELYTRHEMYTNSMLHNPKKIFL